jgi:hypothetical protein
MLELMRANGELFVRHPSSSTTTGPRAAYQEARSRVCTACATGARTVPAGLLGCLLASAGIVTWEAKDFRKRLANRSDFESSLASYDDVRAHSHAAMPL